MRQGQGEQAHVHIKVGPPSADGPKLDVQVRRGDIERLLERERVREGERGVRQLDDSSLESKTILCMYEAPKSPMFLPPPPPSPSPLPVGVDQGRVCAAVAPSPHVRPPLPLPPRPLPPRPSPPESVGPGGVPVCGGGVVWAEQWGGGDRLCAARGTATPGKRDTPKSKEDGRKVHETHQYS